MAAAHSVRTASVIHSTEKTSDCDVNTKKLIDIVRGYKDPMDDDYNDTDYRYFIPPIQRLWSWKGKAGKKKQNDLLNTVFRGLPVPAVILGHVRNSHGMDRYGVYDGRHRLRTFSMFLNNRIPYTIVSGPKMGTPVYYRDLSEVDRVKFNTYQVSTIVLDGSDRDIESEVFIRTNLGKPLTTEQLCYAEIGRSSLFTRTAEILRDNASEMMEVFRHDFTKTTKDINMRKFIAHWSGFVLAATKKNSGLATTAYPRLCEHKDIPDEEWDHESVRDAFSELFKLYRRVKDSCTIVEKDLKKFMTLGNINAFFLHDLITKPIGYRNLVIDKWVNIVVKVYTHPELHKHVLYVSGAQNLNSTRIAIVMRQIEEHDWETGIHRTLPDELVDDSD